MNNSMIKKDFPILDTEVNGHKVVYFDNAATTQRPLQVLEKVNEYCLHLSLIHI